ncbi:MAG: nucleotidyltransferase family protein [Candidatus Omnitrophica bacterium]|nr:nucleotidyltransferase family protein [Candidatus Omnitrophota bacterium]
MKALILAAGYGTRLAAVSQGLPKPLLTVAGKSLIDHAIDKLRPIQGLTEIVVVSNNKFYGHFCAWAKGHPGLKIRVLNDGTNTNEERLGSVGDMHFVWNKEAAADDWLVIGGDNLFDQDLGQFMAYAQGRIPAVTIGLYDIKDIAAATKFGISAVDQSGRVVSFQEKPKNPPSSLITMCLYYFPKTTLGYIEEYRKESKALDAAGSYIQWLVEKKNVYGFQFNGKWYDIGSVESLQEAQQQFNPR